MSLELVPVTLAAARRFVAERHRHNAPPRGWLFGVGLEDGGELVGVAIAGRPVARALQDGRTLEVVRTATDGTRNANSMLYGAIARAARALGYRRVVTYTLESESGSSLRAVGFEQVAELEDRGDDWASRVLSGQADLFGNAAAVVPGRKRRWELQLSR